MAKIKVYPTSKNATVIKHPIDGKLSPWGSDWTNDGYTMRCLTDGALTMDVSKAWRTTELPIDTSIPPAHATAVADNPPTLKITTR